MSDPSDKPNPLAVEEDFYIEVLEPKPEAQKASEDQQKDLEYFLERLYASLRIPPGLL